MDPVPVLSTIYNRNVFSFKRVQMTQFISYNLRDVLKYLFH